MKKESDQDKNPGANIGKANIMAKSCYKKNPIMFKIRRLVKQNRIRTKNNPISNQNPIRFQKNQIMI